MGFLRVEGLRVDLGIDGITLSGRIEPNKIAKDQKLCTDGR